MGFMDNFYTLVQSSLRVADTAVVFAKNGFDLLLSNNSPRQNAEILRKNFEKLGATYIKLGQLIASSPGLFPKEYVEEMQKCLDNVNPLPYANIKEVINRQFKGKQNQIFSFIDEKPLASASIAQVHAATLVTGEDVVIKVAKIEE